MSEGAMAGKATGGRFFEDFRLGEEIRHAVPRTVSEGDAAVYLALTGARFPLHCAAPLARSLGLPAPPLDDLLLFNLVFGRTVADISQNAEANLGYAEGRFGVPVYPGDTIAARSTVIGLRESSSRRTGTVYVRSIGENQRGEMVLDYVRWVLLPKRDPAAPAPDPVVPPLSGAVAAADIAVPAGLDASRYDPSLAGSPALWEDYAVGEAIGHGAGMTIEESCHMMATRLYQNGARVHFDQHAAAQGRFGRRVVYGGHVISLARALSANGLANALKLVAIHGGRHVAPTFAGDTIHGWSEVLEKAALPGRDDLGLLRLRTLALKNQEPTGRAAEDAAATVLAFDYSVLMPRRMS